MKHILFAAFIFLSISVNAQNFEGGFLGGITGCQIDGDHYGGYSKLGFNLGAYAKRIFSDVSSVQLEIKYEGKGASAGYNFDSNQQVPPDLYRIGLHYIELPISYVYKFHPQFSFYIGAQAGYLFLQTYRDQNGDSYTIDNFKKYEIAGITGLYYHFSDQLNVCLRFSYSITPIFTTEGGVAVREWYRNSYNNGLGLCVYYNLGK